jgi:hypothetical protein
MPSPPFRGEREGTRRVSDGEGEVGVVVAWTYGGGPHLTPTLSAPKGGEGDFQLPADRLQRTPDIFHYIPIPKSDHPVASAGDFPAAGLVYAGPKRVLPAIELNGQLRCRTCEIHHVSPNWMLTTKSVREPQLTQLPPQPPFGLRHILPQATDECGPYPNPHSISIRTAPYSTGCASATRICAMRPGRCARIWFITFIASMISKGCPSATESPSRTKGGSPGCGAR